jgi:hypothetical protein
MKLMMFVKHVQSMPIEESAARQRGGGVAGVDFSVRANGLV